MGWLDRMTQFKEKAGKARDRAAAGLYVYPNLMAADILLYRATHVPVGDDQRQHLELARDIARKFNHDFGAPAGHPDFFPLPEAPDTDAPPTRIMSLRDGTRKMSKSDASAATRIDLRDDADTIAHKIRKAKTDPDHLPDTSKGLEARPEAANLMGLYASLAGLDLDAAVAQFAGRDFSALKDALTELLIAAIVPIGEDMRRLDKSYLDEVLADGAERAAAMAEAVMAEVRAMVGFWTPPRA